MIDVLRPATPGAIQPYEIDQLIGRRALVDLVQGQELCWVQVGE